MYKKVLRVLFLASIFVSPVFTMINHDLKLEFKQKKEDVFFKEINRKLYILVKVPNILRKEIGTSSFRQLIKECNAKNKEEIKKRIKKKKFYINPNFVKVKNKRDLYIVLFVISDVLSSNHLKKMKVILQKSIKEYREKYKNGFKFILQNKVSIIKNKKSFHFVKYVDKGVERLKGLVDIIKKHIDQKNKKDNVKKLFIIKPNYGFYWELMVKHCFKGKPYVLLAKLIVAKGRNINKKVEKNLSRIRGILRKKTFRDEYINKEIDSRVGLYEFIKMEKIRKPFPNAFEYIGSCINRKKITSHSIR